MLLRVVLSLLCYVSLSFALLLSCVTLCYVGYIVLCCVMLCCVHRKNPTVVRHRCAQRCDSENEHSAVTEKTSTAL